MIEDGEGDWVKVKDEGGEGHGEGPRSQQRRSSSGDTEMGQRADTGDHSLLKVPRYCN